MVDQDEQTTSLDELAPPETISTVATSTVDIVAPMVDLPDGWNLDHAAAALITKKAPTRVIILAGAVDSGKTTLLASLYERFQEGPFAGYLFAGSQTLLGFESRCHLARTASGRATAMTERTKYGTTEYLLHLRVRVQDQSKPAQDLLLTDLSGEVFSLVSDCIDECKSLTILRRADHFVLLLDSGKLADMARRHAALQEGVSLLRSCLDAEMLGKHSLVDVLFTKWDVIEQLGARQQSAATAFIERAQREIRDRFSGRVAHLCAFRVAARPEQVTLPLAYGLEDVLPSWIEEVPRRSCGSPDSPIEVVSRREFDRYYRTRLRMSHGGGSA